MMQTPQEAVDLAKQFEGLYLNPYICPAGFPTVGYGHLIPSLEHPAITKEEAEALLSSDMQTATSGAIRMCPVLLLEPTGRLAALADFCFNLGVGRLQASTLRRRINQGDWNEVIYELKRWVNGGGRKLQGLVLRREAEAQMILRAKKCQ